MIKVTEYEHHAEECRKMARHTGNAEQKAQLEEMAQAWEALARDRAEQIRKGMIATAAQRPLASGGGKRHQGATKTDQATLTGGPATGSRASARATSPTDGSS